MKFIRSMCLMGWAMVALAASDARASLLVFSNPDAPLPTSPGNGLIANYYRPTGGVTSGTLAVANAYVAGHSADASFVSTGINYVAGAAYGSGTETNDSSSVSSYLGSDGNSLVAKVGSPSGETTAQVLNNNLNGTIYTFTGYLAITAAQVNTVQTFYIGSDDGSSFSIQGQQVLSSDGDHVINFTSGGNTVEFTQAGLYAINVTYFEDAGGTGIEFGSTLAGAGTYGQELTSSSFYTAVPEPSSLTLMGLAGVIACGFARMKARRQARA